MSLRLDQVLIAIVGACTVALVGSSLVACARGRVRAAALVVAVLVMIGVFAAAGPFATDGYLDLVTGAATCAAVVYGLVAPRTREHVLIALVCAYAATAAKNDGVPVAVLVIALMAVRHLWATRPSVRGWLATAAVTGALCVPALLWPVVSAADHAVTMGDDRPRLSPLLRGDPQLGPRLTVTFHGLTPYLHLLPVAAAIAFAGMLVLRGGRRRLELGPFVLLWLALTWGIGFLTLVYVTGTPPIDWWMATSANRATIAFQAMLLAEVGVWAVVGADEVADRFRRVWTARGSRTLPVFQDVIELGGVHDPAAVEPAPGPLRPALRGAESDA